MKRRGGIARSLFFFGENMAGKLFTVVMKIHGLIPVKEEQEYIDALQYLLDRGLSYDMNEFVTDVTNLYLKENRLSIPPEIIN